MCGNDQNRTRTLQAANRLGKISRTRILQAANRLGKICSPGVAVHGQVLHDMTFRMHVLHVANQLGHMWILWLYREMLKIGITCTCHASNLHQHFLVHTTACYRRRLPYLEYFDRQRVKRLETMVVWSLSLARIQYLNVFPTKYEDYLLFPSIIGMTTKEQPCTKRTASETLPATRTGLRNQRSERPFQTSICCC